MTKWFVFNGWRERVFLLWVRWRGAVIRVGRMLNRVAGWEIGAGRVWEMGASLFSVSLHVGEVGAGVLCASSMLSVLKSSGMQAVERISVASRMKNVKKTR